MFNFWFDITARYAYELGRGMIHRYSGGLGGFYETDLIGSVINGEEVGMTEIPVVSTVSQPQHIELAVYPNPASSQIYIEGLDKFESYVIYDQVGKQARSGQSGKTPVDIADLAPGTYVLAVRIEDGSSGLARFVVLK